MLSINNLWPVENVHKDLKETQSLRETQSLKETQSLIYNKPIDSKRILIKNYKIEQPNYVPINFSSNDTLEQEFIDFDNNKCNQKINTIEEQLQIYSEEEAMLHNIEQRNEKIKEINKGINVLSETFADLHDIVLTQQESIDSIEKSTSTTETKVEQANTELITADQYQTSASQYSWIFASIISGIIGIVVINLVN